MSVRGLMSPTLQRKAAHLKREFQHAFAKGGMPKFLDQVFGRGAWRYDEREQLWIVPDTRYRGPGCEFYCINIEGDWFKARILSQEAQ
ncbi:hypothetical protein [Ferrovum myxofaciens]|uniref:hypothetical protein n=1 Tax=Ferrovum myxofaciens TaxID=416213 RepID=UPI002354C45B|nr:hypothetical protein [Ferrovum myxofaciens]MBU6995859.1 hypothetical protein [Ferrovum myxofaciens]